MSTQTRNRVIEGPLSVVLRPDSEAAASYRSAVLAPGFGPEPGLDLRFFGGKTLPHLRYSIVYLGSWQAQERSELDHALAAAMRDRELNNVLAQYFPGTDVTTTFAGSKVHEGSLPERVTRDVVEALVPALDLGPTVACLLLPKGAVLVDTGDVDSKHGLGGYHGSVKVNGSERYYAVAVYSDGRQRHRRLRRAVEERLRDAVPRAAGDPDRSRRRGRDPPGVGARRRPAARLVLAAGGEIGDIPMAEAGGDISRVMKEVPLSDGSGTVPIQLMWSNAVGGPEGPTPTPRPPQ